MNNLYNILHTQGLLHVTQAAPMDAPKTTEAITLPNGETRMQLLDNGVLQFEPKQKNLSKKSIVISSGIHGNETAPIEIVDQLATAIIHGRLPVNHRLLLIIGNPVAIEKQQRFVVENMNRLFSGAHQGKDHWEAARAAKLEHYLQIFFDNDPQSERLHYDLHTAIRESKFPKFAIYPYRKNRDWDQPQLHFLEACGIEALLLADRPAHTFSYFSSNTLNAHAFTLELGQVKPFGQNNLQAFTALIKQLSELISGKVFATSHNQALNLEIFEVKTELLKKSSGFKLNFAKDIKNFTEFDKGFLLCSDIDGGYRVEEDGEAIVFPNVDIPIGQRAGLIVTKTEF